MGEQITIPQAIQLERLDLVLNPPIKEARTIKNPYWDNDQRVCIHCEFHYPDGRVLNAAVNKADRNNLEAVNADWIEIMENFTVAEIEKYTRGMKKKAEEHERAKKAAARKWEEESARQQIYEVKLQALEEVDLIKHSKNQALKKRLRKAKTLVEVFAFSTLLIQEALASNQLPDSDRKI